MTDHSSDYRELLEIQELWKKISPENPAVILGDRAENGLICMHSYRIINGKPYPTHYFLVNQNNINLDWRSDKGKQVYCMGKCDVIGCHQNGILYTSTILRDTTETIIFYVFLCLHHEKYVIGKMINHSKIKSAAFRK